MAIASVWLEATHLRRFALDVLQRQRALALKFCAALLAPGQQLGAARLRAGPVHRAGLPLARGRSPRRLAG
jgi:hypothetical protein